MTINRYSKHAAAAGYKPAPQLGRLLTRFVIVRGFNAFFSVKYRFYRYFQR